MPKEKKTKEVKIIAGFLASALDIEDSMSKNVYGDFLDNKTWPSGLSDRIFAQIRGLLLILIDETEEHRKLFLELKRNLGKNAS